MPVYEFRCKDCGTEFSLFYKSTSDYASAEPACTHCNSTALSRLIRRVNVASPSHDYANMSSTDMLKVLESGDEKQVEDMYRQVSGTHPADAPSDEA